MAITSFCWCIHPSRQAGMLKLLRPGFTAGLRNCSDQKKPEDTEKDEETALPEEPTTCCMSGCANCVWIDYAEILCKHYKDGGKKAREVILSKVTDPAVRSFLMLELQNLENKSE